MKNKLVALTAVMTAACMLIAGCGTEKVTAEELIAGAYPDDMSTMTADIRLGFKAGMSLEQLGGEGTMDMGLSLDAKMESDKDTKMIDGSASIEIFGMTIDQEMKQYVQTDGDVSTTYTYSEEDGTWTYDSGESEDVTGIGIDPSMFKEATLREADKKDDAYHVDALISSEGLAAVAGVDTEELLGIDGSDISIEGVTFNVSMSFDKKTKNLTAFKIWLDKPYEEDGAEIRELSIEMTNITFSNNNVSIPDDILDNAMDINDMFGGFGGDDSFSVDDGSYGSGLTTDSATGTTQSGYEPAESNNMETTNGMEK